MDRFALNLLCLAALSLGAMQLPEARAQDRPRSLYDGATLVFQQAQLVKPRETAAFGVARALAPLIIQEVRGSNTVPASDPEAALASVNRTDQPESAPTEVFFQPGAVQLNSLKYEQMTYWWFHDQPANRAVASRKQPQRETSFKGGAGLLMQRKAAPRHAASELHDDFAPAQLQGVRLTMNAKGVPVIYEVLGNRGSIEQVFVTQSIEAAAHAEFGPALPGRRHAVERSLNDAPGVVVPRVIEDPPDVMGPIVYLHPETHAVATLVCRCMNAQVKQLAGQRLYELVPAEASGNTSAATRLEAAFPRWLREDFTKQTDRLSRSLRLPAGF